MPETIRPDQVDQIRPRSGIKVFLAYPVLPPAQKLLGGTVSNLHIDPMDRGCSARGCDVPGYLCEVHHVEEWAECYRTDIDNLTFACGPHHRLLKPGGWTTRKRADGPTEWIPNPTPPRAKYPHDGQPRTNTFHHPEKLLRDNNDDEEKHAGR